MPSFLLLDQLRRSPPDRFLESRDVAGQNLVHLELRGGPQQGVIERVLHRVGGVHEVEHIADRLVDPVGQRGARVNDVVIGRERIAIHGGIEGSACHDGRFDSREPLFGRLGIPAGRRLDRLNSGDVHLDALVNRIGQGPVQLPRSKQGLLALRRGVCRTAE